MYNIITKIIYSITPSRGNDHCELVVHHTGFDPIPGGVLGDTYFLSNGWKLCGDLYHVKISDVLFSDDYDTVAELAVCPAPVSTMSDKTTIGGYIKKTLLSIPAF